MVTQVSQTGSQSTPIKTSHIRGLKQIYLYHLKVLHSNWVKTGFLCGCFEKGQQRAVDHTNLTRLANVNNSNSLLVS